MEGTTMRAQDEMRLHAYHDGELSGFARWRFERTLRRSPGLQRELAALKSLSGLLHQQEAGAGGVDLWDRIALGLPAADARRAEERESPSASGRSAGWWLKPIGAMAATAAVAVAYLYPGTSPTAPISGNVVRWIDSGDRGVVVLEDDPDSTIIWVMDDAVDGASIGGGSDLV
jgi:anti-sigma factor RsiW